MATKYSQVVKTVKPLKILLYGPTWSGKTMSSLLLAQGIVVAKRQLKDPEKAWQHIVLHDSEYGRGTLYAHLGTYNYIKKDAPYRTEDLVQDIQTLNADPQIDVIIVDSFTHYWSKDGGILEQKAAKDKLGGNSYANWQDYTEKFNKAVTSLIASPKVVIATARAKSDRAIIQDTAGKVAVKTYGLKPDLRDDIDFEFDIVLNIDKETHSVIVDKGLVGMEPTYTPITMDFGAWLETYYKQNAVIAKRTEHDVKESITQLVKDYKLVSWFQIDNNGRKIADMSLDELLAAEGRLIKHIKTSQGSNKR